MGASVKKRADVVYQDFIVRTTYKYLLVKAIRETIKYSQSYLARKISYHATIINVYENGGKISRNAEKDILDFLRNFNFTKYTDCKTDDFIIYTIRVMSCYLCYCHEYGYYEDDEMCKKLISKNVSMLGFEE